MVVPSGRPRPEHLFLEAHAYVANDETDRKAHKEQDAVVRVFRYLFVFPETVRVEALRKQLTSPVKAMAFLNIPLVVSAFPVSHLERSRLNRNASLNMFETEISNLRSQMSTRNPIVFAR